MAADRSVPEIPDAVAKLCARLPWEYWRELDRDLFAVTL